MEIKALPKEINERIRSNNNISNICQCILELVFNSLDAKATSIAVRINIENHQVTIVDNGNGMSLSNLQNAGVRYMTSKCESLYTYENKHKCYGYRGETLASIICVSKKVIITTRYHDGEFTYVKTFEDGSFVNIVSSNIRSSKGTTVTVAGFFFNCPVKQKRIKNTVDLNNVKVSLKSLSIIHPNVSFSLRDDNTSKILLNCFKTKSVTKSLCALYQDIIPEKLIEVKVSKDNIYVSGLIYTETYKNTKPQLIYVNKRPANVEIITKYVNETLSKTLQSPITNPYPLYIINISCPYSILDILFDSCNIVVEFKSRQVVTKCVEKMLKLFTDKYKNLNSQDESNSFNDFHHVENNMQQDIRASTSNEGNDENEQKRVLENEHNQAKQTYMKTLRDLKAYKKTLGLKKTKFKLKKKKQNNIFDRTADLSNLSLQEFPPNMPLKIEKQKKDPVCSKNIYDDIFDSQHLIFHREGSLQDSLATKTITPNDELSGKEFVMDLFLNSLTPSVNQDIVLPSKLVKEIESNGDPNSPKLDAFSQFSNEKNIIPSKVEDGAEISFHNQIIKKRRIEKLNRIGTSLIKNKLEKLRRINSEVISTPIINYKDVQKCKSLSTYTSEESVNLIRSNLDDKAIQTSFTERYEYDTVSRESRAIQTSFRIDLNSEINVDVGNPYRILSQKEIAPKKYETYNNPLFTLKTENHPHRLLVPHETGTNSITFQPDQLNLKIEESVECFNKALPILNDTTFISHCNPIFIEPRPKLYNNTIVHINTKDTIANLNNTLLTQNHHRETYENFRKHFENAARDKTIQSLTHNFTLNYTEIDNGLEECGNTSKFFAIKQNRVNVCSTNHKEMKRSDISVLIDTSTFLQRNIGNDVDQTSKLNYFDSHQSSKKNKDEFYNQTALSFNKFLPISKSTQKEAKHCGRVYNFFESFMFNDCNRAEKENINTDITFGTIFSEEKRNGEIKSTQRLDNIESNYCIERADMTVFKPLLDEQLFMLKRRADFIPKGLSPILKEANSINLSLSPSSKKKLNNAIIESYENELDLIKWQDFIDKEDPKRFFNLLYEEKCKQIEEIIPKISDVHVMNIRKVYSPNQSYTFTKDIFKKLDILGQLDNKFIVALSNFTLIILLDQHAVHERIRVEALLEYYTMKNVINDRIMFKSVKCIESLTINFTNTELQLLDTFKTHFQNVGLHFKIHRTFIEITKIPLCFARKCINSEENLHKFVNNLINDELCVLNTTRGIPSNIPKIIQYAINNEACRGAVKFGQKLTHNECSDYMMNLSKCQLPFQCAHGRPTLYPILEISTEGEKLKYNIRRLKI